MTATKYLRGVDWEGTKAALTEKPAAPTGHPTRADDDVGRIAGDLAPWALGWATDLIIAASKHRPRAERIEALARLSEAWPKICRRMTELEAVAPNAFAEGSSRDAAMQERIAARAENTR